MESMSIVKIPEIHVAFFLNLRLVELKGEYIL
jgi:hypothetical protein